MYTERRTWQKVRVFAIKLGKNYYINGNNYENHCKNCRIGVMALVYYMVLFTT